MGSQAAQTDEGEYKKGPAGNRLALGGVLAFEVLLDVYKRQAFYHVLMKTKAVILFFDPHKITSYLV